MSTTKTKKHTRKSTVSRAKTPARKTQVSKAKSSARKPIIVHHAKRVFHATPKFVHGMVAGAVVGLLVVSFLRANVPASAADCDTNAVIWCGASSPDDLYTTYHKNGGDGHNTSASIQSIYSWFGISSASIDALRASSQNGSVTKSGDVYVGTTLVAKDAVTGGRSYISGSTKETVGSTAFYVRPPSVSFASDSLSAMVYMKDNVFQFAVLNSCANPVKATPTTAPPPPPKTPSYSIQKQVHVSGSNVWQSLVSALSGSTVQYRVVVKSTGNAPATNIRVTDQLPASLSYKSGTLKRDGTGVNAANFFGSRGDIISSLSPGSSVIYTFDVVVGPKDIGTSCTPKTLTNTAAMSAPGLPNENSSANVNEQCAPNPNYSCTNMSVVQLSTTNFNFTVNASVANGAKIVSYIYNFGDGNSKTVTSNATSNSIAHDYGGLGTYQVTASVVISFNGKQVTSNTCETTVTPTASLAAASVTSLPNTGPGAVIIIAVLSVIGGYAAHHTHRHIQRKRRAARHGA